MKFAISKDSLRGYQEEVYGVYLRLDDKCIIQAAKVSDDNKSFPLREELPTFLDDYELIFVEISFDPISRIKRGKFYKAVESQPLELKSYNGDLQLLQRRNDNSLLSISLRHFTSYYPVRESFDLVKAVIYLGNIDFRTRWNILSIDASATNEEIYIIQQVHGIGIIPNVDYAKIEVSFHSEISREFTSLISEMNGHPESVVEHCKSLVVSILSAYLKLEKNQNYDIGILCEKIKDREQVRNYSNVVRIYHSRCKPNLIRTRDYREVNRFDSDYAIYSTFQILRDLGWVM